MELQYIYSDDESEGENHAATEFTTDLSWIRRGNYIISLVQAALNSI